MDIDFAAWAALIGAALPLLISFLKQSAWSTNVKKYVATAVSVVVAFVYTGAQEGWAISSFDDFWSLAIVSAAGIYALAQATYLGFWENTAVEVRAAKTLDLISADSGNDLAV